VNRPLVCVLMLMALLGSGLAQDKPVQGLITGRILDYETQQPLPGVAVTVKDTGFVARSDDTGSFEIPDIPVGYYIVTFQLEGYYTETQTDVIVRPGRTTAMNVQLFAVRQIKEEVRVTADYFPKTPDKPVSQMQISAEELRRDAGAVGDVSRALYNVPGIIKADEQANDLIVRGGSPAENGFYVDNIFMPNINHFPQWGASGGNISMLNMDFVEHIQIYTGGFDASYGNRLSSILDIGYREGDRERIGGQLNLSLLGYGAQAEGPFPRKKGTWMVSGNQSYLDIIGNALGDIGAPSYNDIQGKAVYDLDAGNRLSILAITGNSQTQENRMQEASEGAFDYSHEKFNVSTAGLNWRHLWGKIGYSDTSLSYSSIKGREDWWRTSDDLLLQYLEYRQQWVTFRNISQVQLSPAHQLRFGIEAQHLKFRNFAYYEDTENKLSGSFASAFATYVVYPFRNFSLSPGIRLDYFPFSERYHVSPRFSCSWVLTERLSLNGAFGYFHQQMPIFLLVQHPDNTRLQDLKARHLVLGFKYLLRHDTQLTLEAYDKQYEHFPMSALSPYYFMIDDISGDDARFGDWGPLVDLGAAWSRGVELTLQKKISKSLYGLVNLTFYRARYRDLMGVWRNRMYDNRFIVGISGGYKPSRFWEINVRWTWAGNRAFTPVNEAKSKEVRGVWVDYEDIMSGHLKDYNNLSLRIDRRIYFRGSNLVIFTGALNIFDLQNELYRYWDSRVPGYISEYMWGRIPYIGFEFEF
jgi:outer membrane receptor for ferrienterochelin and colicin